MKEDTEIKQEDLCPYIEMADFKAHRDEALKTAPRLYEGDDFEPGDDPFYLLSKAYAEGEHGLQKDERKADEYLKKSADACVMSARREVALRVAPRLSEDDDFGEYTDPYYSLAQAYLYGKYGLEKNIEKGLEYLKNSADFRFTDSCYDYSRVLAAGILCKADLEKAAEYAFAGTGYDSYLGGTEGLCEEVGIACVHAIDNSKYEFFVNYWDGIVIRKLPGTHEYVMKRYYDVVNNGVTIKAGVESPLNTHAFKLPTQYGGHCIPISEELYNCFGKNWVALPFKAYGDAIGDESASDMWNKFDEEFAEKEGAAVGELSQGVEFCIEEVSPQSLHERMSEVQHTDDAFFAYLRVAESAKDDINPNLSDADRVKSYMAVARCYLEGLHGLAPASENWGSWGDAYSWLQDAADLGCAEAKEELKKHEETENDAK